MSNALGKKQSIKNTEWLEAIKENAARNEQKIQQAKEAPDPAQVQEEPQADDETADIKKFVICPKCGEKIWL